MTVVLWASAFVGIRAAGEDISPGPLTLGRLLVAAAVLGLIVAARRDPLPPRAISAGCSRAGCSGSRAYNVLLNAAEQRIDAGTAAMLVNVGPVLIALLAGVLLHEGFPRSLLTGCAIAFAGAIVIGARQRRPRRRRRAGAPPCASPRPLAYSGGVIAQKPLLERTSALQITFLACVDRRRRCLPFARHARRRGRRGAGILPRLGRLPGRVPDRDRLHDLGVRPEAHERRAGWARRRISSRPSRC